MPTAAEAWEEVSRLIQLVGPYRSPQYSSELVRRATRAIGWRQLCTGENPEADRAHFLKIYEAMRGKYRENRANEAALALSGMDVVFRTLAEHMAVK